MQSKFRLTRREPVTRWNQWSYSLSVCLLLVTFGGCPTASPDPTDAIDLPDDAPAGDLSPGTDTNPSPVAAPPKDVTESLAALGVNTTETPRVDETGTPLPTDYSPLGSACTVAQTAELFIVGPQLRFTDPAGGSQTLPNKAGFLELANESTAELALSFDLLNSGQPWEIDTDSAHPSLGNSTAGAQTTRTAATGDIDNDGKEEILIVYIADSAAAGTQRLYLQVIHDAETPSAPTLLGEFPGAKDVTAVASDLDGDGDADLAFGICTNNTSEQRILSNNGGTFEPLNSATRVFVPNIVGSELSLELASGNLDRDNGHELVVVLNEFDGANFTGTAHYWVFDDAKTGFVQLAGNQPVSGSDGQVYAALVADVALGDIDADGRDEIVFAGLTEFQQDACASYGHIHIAFEDAADADNPLGALGARFIRDTYVEQGTGCNSNSHTLRVRKLFVSCLDVDGDGIAEVHAGRRVFEDWSHAAPWTEKTLADGTPVILPYDEFLKSTETSGGTISDATCAVATGDVTGDGREDIISFVQWRDEINVWGLIGPGESTWQWQKVMTIPTGFANGQTRIFPIIVACNVDSDGLTLKYSEGEHRVLFTQPILMAALAAAPCQGGINQNFDACRTTYGTGESQQLGVDGTVSVRASAWIGGDVNIFGFGAEAKATATRTVSFSAGRSYELEQMVEYTTGPREDTVICAVLPIDQYIYTVLSHPDPAMIGKRIEFNLPRTPITLQVEREFYNASTPANAFKVGKNVFLHTPGDIASYPTPGDADALIDTGGLGHLGPLGQLVDSVGAALGPIAEHLLGKGIKSTRAVGVGATNGGESSIELRFAEHTDYRAGTEIDYEIEAETTVAGLVVGGSVGGGLDAGLSWGSGNSTVYRGTVGDIAPADYPGHGYSYGLFTYVYNYGDRSKPQFEVVNYWVEQ